MARLYRAGSAGMMRSLQWPGTDDLPDPESLFTSLATGKPPRAHGITATAERAPGSPGLRPITADRRRSPALWTIAGGRGVTVGVVGWPVTFPVEQVNGFMVADGYEPGARSDHGYLHPPDALGTGGSPGEPLALSAASAQVAALDPELALAFNRDLAALGSGLALYRVYQPGLAFFRFTSLDLAAHRFWQYHEPRYLEVMATRGTLIDKDRAAALAGVVSGACAFFDEWLGMLSERLPEKATLIVVSAHGMRGVGMTDYLHLDMTRLVGLLPADLLEAGALLTDLDVSAGSRRSLYLEMKGNQTDGNAAARRELLSRTALALRALRTEQGEPLLSSVTVNETPRPGEPDLEFHENMGINPSGSIRFGESSRPVTSLFRRYSDDFGAHDRDGMILAAGDGIVTGRTGWSADLYDLAPTALTLLGLPLADDMPGRPLEEFLAAGSQAERTRIPSYDDLFIPIAPKHRPEADIAREIERLRSLSHLWR